MLASIMIQPGDKMRGLTMVCQPLRSSNGGGEGEVPPVWSRKILLSFLSNGIYLWRIMGISGFEHTFSQCRLNHWKVWTESRKHHLEKEKNCVQECKQNSRHKISKVPKKNAKMWRKLESFSIIAIQLDANIKSRQWVFILTHQIENFNHLEL